MARYNKEMTPDEICDYLRQTAKEEDGEAAIGAPGDGDLPDVLRQAATMIERLVSDIEEVKDRG